MHSIPEQMLAVRRRIAKQYLHGSGLELGGLHAPLETSGVVVKYVDRMPENELRQHYPELADLPLVPVDIVDDGEKLSTLPDASQDFIIANHMMEHTENPLGTIRNHIAKLRPHGILYYAVPDKRYSFDLHRPLTDFSHLVCDDSDQGDASRFSHYLEWMTLVENRPEPVAPATRQMNSRYSIHFHVWTANSWLEFLVAARAYLNNKFEIWHFERNDTEIISILRADSGLVYS